MKTETFYPPQISSLSIHDNGRAQLEADDETKIEGIDFVNYRDESDLASVMRLVGKDLSEPYSTVPSITGNNDPAEKREPIGCVVCKIDEEFQGSQIVKSGYMAMLAVDMAYRKAGIGTALVKRAVKRMQHKGCSSVTLETEVSNVAAIRLYEERLGFVREELLVRYYLNWGDAYRLRLWL